ncbi:unnamed protein product [Ilex paraguariensis]|uniref:SHSP domain-containing protein n=1 Tax=Ilex paraguariensis TaxID=185542 RepID=A0ABC8RTM1_9AQUA
MRLSFKVVLSLLCCFLLLMGLTTAFDGGLLLPFGDRPPSFPSDLLADRFPDPFRVLEQLPLALKRDESLLLSPARVDWKETPKAHEIMVDVPGLQKGELRIEVDQDNRVVQVAGDRKREEEKKTDRWHRVERSYGKFWREFRLPENVDLDSIKAKLENGVLTVSIAKKSPDRINGPKVVTIAVGEEGGGGESIQNAKKSEAKQEL